MKLQGEHLFPVPQERLWQALLDPEVLQNTLPGCEELTQTGENEYRGKLKVKVGPVQGLFQGTVKLLDLDPPNGYRLELDGRGAPGFLKGSGTIRLEGADGGTTLAYDLDAQVGGRIAAVGQRLIESSAKVITRQGLEGLERQLPAEAPAASGGGEAGSAEPATGSAAPETPATAPATPAPPTQAELAGEVVKGVLDDLVPRSARPWLLLAALLVVATLVAVVLRCNP